MTDISLSSGRVRPPLAPPHEAEGRIDSEETIRPSSFLGRLCAAKGGHSEGPDGPVFIQEGSAGELLSGYLVPVQTKEDANTAALPPWTPDPETIVRMEEWNRQSLSRFPEATPFETRFRHSGWEPKRRRVRAALVDAGVSALRLHRFDHCGSGCVCEKNSDTGEIRLRANYCGDRFCDPCANARSCVIRRKIESLMGQGRHSMIELTLRHERQPLEAFLDYLLVSFKKIREHKFWKNAVSGGAFFIEITMGQSGDEWHVHLHVIVQSGYIKFDELRNAWQKVTGTSHVCRVTEIVKRSSGANYAAKYATKGFDMSVVNNHGALVETVKSLSGRRMVGTFGDWWQTDLVEDKKVSGRWEVLGSFESLVHLAESGDADSMVVLRMLTARAEAHLFGAGRDESG